MKPYSQLSKEELTALKKELEKQFEDVKGKGLKPVSYTHLTLPTIA